MCCMERWGGRNPFRHTTGYNRCTGVQWLGNGWGRWWGPELGCSCNWHTSNPHMHSEYAAAEQCQQGHNLAGCTHETADISPREGWEHAPAGWEPGARRPC